MEKHNSLIKNFWDLEIYRIAEDIAVVIYQISSRFPNAEVYGVTSQLRRAVTSIGANIAEGFGRYHYKDKIRFLHNARGSLFEVAHFLRVSRRLGFITKEDCEATEAKLKTLSVKLNNFITALRKNIPVA